MHERILATAAGKQNLWHEAGEAVLDCSCDETRDRRELQTSWVAVVRQGQLVRLARLPCALEERPAGQVP
jgi:hypothetical protein